MKVSKLNNFFGAELQGIDLRNLKSKTVDDLKSLWIEHKVLVIRNQSLTTEEHVNFAKNFGDLEVHPFARKHPDYQEILVLESGGKTGNTLFSKRLAFGCYLPRKTTHGVNPQRSSGTKSRRRYLFRRCCCSI